MLISLGDFLRKRNDRGEKWPSRELIYQWKFYNYFHFSDECVRTLGSKILIDEEGFERWLVNNASRDQEGKNVG